MLEGLFMLLSLSVLMGIASFGAGLLPLSFSLSSSQLRLVSTIGMGVLVGTSLIVIIPEGIETLNSANEEVRTHERRALQNRGLDVRWAAPMAQVPKLSTDYTKRASDEVDAINALPGPVIPVDADITGDRSYEPPKTPTTPGEVHALDDSDATESQPDEHKGDQEHQEEGSDHEEASEEEQEHDEHKDFPHAWIGLALIMGFILMYLVDTLPSLKPPQPPQRNNIYSLSDLSASSSPSPGSSTPKSSFSTTLGLVIHSAADGIALGASSTQPSISWIIFFAIFIHKAPAAFGLTSVLLKQGLGKRQARSHLIAFSIAAPIGAVSTFLLIHILGGGSLGASGAHSKWWTGMVLLFSGGSFLYVAMHTMQDEDHETSGANESAGNGYLDGRDTRPQKPQKTLQLTMAAVGGMLLPLLTQVGHSH